MKYLSIAIPCYNVENYIKKCLDSFSDERFIPNLEVLIINDGSSDRTEEIAQNYVDRFPELFRLISKENGGHGSAVNCGIEHASGKYFRIVDGDDWIDTEQLICLMDRIREIDTDLIVDQKRRVDMNSLYESQVLLPENTIFDIPLLFENASDETICHYYSLHTVSVKLDLLKEQQIHLMEHTFYVDNEYLLKTAAYAKDVIFLNLDIYRYLVGNITQSVSHNSYVQRYDQHERVIRECLHFSQIGGKWSEKKLDYMIRRILPLIRTHYLIALIYETKRKEGLKKTIEFRSFLKKTYPQFAKATMKRYIILCILHALGVTDTGLQKLKKLTGIGDHTR